LDEGMGYEFEIRSFVDEILRGEKSDMTLLNQAAKSIAIIEAEQVSIRSCSVVTLSV
jgi:predicted dehydrogenase